MIVPLPPVVDAETVYCFLYLAITSPSEVGKNVVDALVASEKLPLLDFQPAKTYVELPIVIVSCATTLPEEVVDDSAPSTVTIFVSAFPAEYVAPSSVVWYLAVTLCSSQTTVTVIKGFFSSERSSSILTRCSALAGNWSAFFVDSPIVVVTPLSSFWSVSSVVEEYTFTSVAL